VVLTVLLITHIRYWVEA